MRVVPVVGRTTQYARLRQPKRKIFCAGNGRPGKVGPGVAHGWGENPMKKGALALIVHGGTENWSPERWKQPVRRGVRRPARGAVARCRSCDPADVHYAAVWKPAPGELAAFPNLRVIFNLGAGVDALMADASLPNVPLVRVSVGDLTARMTEYVVLHVLMHHRQELYLRASQREKRWAAEISMAGGRHFGRHHGPRRARSERRRSAGAVLAFASPAGAIAENRSKASIAFMAQPQLDAFLRRTDILVCLLPLTSDTRHILNRGSVRKTQPYRRRWARRS